MPDAAGATRGGARCRPYNWLARYYDVIFPSTRSWGEPARRQILDPILPGIESACDLACGTGATAVWLAQRGIRTFAVDLSPGMCRLARQKARQCGVDLRVVRADMREFRLPQAVDLVTCEFDALNHLPRKPDLAMVLNAVAGALTPGGCFYFDVNNRLSFERLWPLTWYIEKPGVAVVMHGGYDRATGKAWSDVDWFIREGGLWRRRRERVEEVCWTSAEIRAALREAGFHRVRAWDATRFFLEDKAMRPGYRTYYLAWKRPRQSGTR